jgi:hypothetical protein
MHEIGVSKPPRSLQIGVSKPPRSLQIWGKQTSAFFQGLSGNNKFLNNVAFNGRTSCLLPGDVWLAVVPWWPSLLSHLIYAAISLRISHGADFCCSASNGQHKRRQHRPSESVWKCLVQWMPRVSRSRKLQVSASKCMRRQQRRLCSMPYVSCTVRSEPRELLPLPPACLLPCTCQTRSSWDRVPVLHRSNDASGEGVWTPGLSTISGNFLLNSYGAGHGIDHDDVRDALT